MLKSVVRIITSAIQRVNECPGIIINQKPVARLAGELEMILSLQSLGTVLPRSKVLQTCSRSPHYYNLYRDMQTERKV
jgi:hypothetical protein